MMVTNVFPYLLPFCNLSLVSTKKFAIGIDAFVPVSIVLAIACNENRTDKMYVRDTGPRITNPQKFASIESIYANIKFHM